MIGIARRMGVALIELIENLEQRHPSVGATRFIGLFGVVELIRDGKPRTPMAPFNGTSNEMTALSHFFRKEGLYTFFRWDTFFTNPTLMITEKQLREAFSIIDRGLEITDQAVSG